MVYLRTNISSLLAVISVVLALGITGPANAITLEEARNMGLVGEKPDGLIAAVSPQTAAEVSALITEINSARLESYQQLSKKDGAPIEAVQAIAGEKLLQRARENGWYVMSASGTWSR